MDHPGIIPIGVVLAGRYRVERTLGQGGMGVVVKAMHLQLNQPVAMKFLLPEVLGNQQVVQRFLREAQAAVRLKSEHVARVIDVGSLETGAPYMVLEYLEGADLSNFPRSQLSVGGVVDLMLQACEALAEAHSLGIVHRDIKPANFFITRGSDGLPLLKVLDFGISKSPTTGSNLTATQSVMGTPAYMSPEQMRSSRDVDHRTDIWALGVVLYELLQGTAPYGGDTFSSMVIKVVNEPLPRMTVALPGDLDAIVYRCLEKDPARRFQNVAELAQALARYAQSDTQAAISVQRTRSIIGLEARRSSVEAGPGGRAIPPSTLSGAAGARTSPPGTGRRWPIFAGLGVLVAVVAVAVVASNGGGGEKAAGPGPAVPPAAASQQPPGPAVPPAVAPPATPPAAPPASAVVATPPAPAAAPAAQPPAAPPPAPATATAQPAAPAQPAGAQATQPAATTAPDAAPVAKKPKKPSKPGKSEGSAKPPDDDVLGSRN
ncbi:MAG TPA: serine/threonine-protein kinase [Kofleriaceae bacterium]|nr:serine/threonine-protein kinase [Kofleriaceae bacterium]